MIYHSIKDILELAENDGLDFSQVILKYDSIEQGIEESIVFEKMRCMYQIMREADRNYRPDLKSDSGLAGGQGEKFREYEKSGQGLLGTFLSGAVTKALRMAESNACMRRIVAAPTAGACGMLPAVLITYEEQTQCPEDAIIRALFVAAGIGQIIAERASIAGASGGCQAEVGSGCAMAAGALTYLRGGDSEVICSAAALGLKSLLGLTCDPVAGLVEVPCIKRNATAASIAVTASDMAMAGIASAIPLDEVIDAMNEIGQNMPRAYRETSEGGLAVTPTGKKYCK